MCVLWMPANLISQGIVDKNDKIFKKENKNAHLDKDTAQIAAEKKAFEEQTEKK